MTADALDKYDVTDHPELQQVEMMPLCPFCEQPMWHFETLALIKWTTPHGTVCGLAHQECLEDQ